MANHLEDLVAEWLEFKGYFTRKSVLVGKRINGGFDGELDVIGWNPQTEHLLHIECSLDAYSWAKREKHYSVKFERGRKHIPELFDGFAVIENLDQVALLQLGGGDRTTVGGARLVWVQDFIADILEELSKSRPDKDAVPSTFPMVRALQLAANIPAKRKSSNRLIDMIS